MVRNINEKLGFKASNVGTLFENFNGFNYRGEDLFTINKNLSGNFDTVPAEFDWEFGATAGLVPYLNLGKLGSSSFEFPINTDLTLPTDIDPDRQFSIGTGFKVDDSAQIKGEGIDLSSFGLDFKYGVGPINVKDIGIGNVLGYSLYEPDDISFNGFKPKTFNIIKADATNVKLDFLGDFTNVGVDVKFPDQIKVDPVKIDSLGDGVLPNIQASGTETIINLAVDIDGLAANIPALKPFVEPLGNQFDLGNGVEFSYDLIDVKANIGLGLQQDITFNPNVSVTMSVDDAQTQTKLLGESFDFTAPQTESGVLEVDLQYELSGDIKTDFGLTPIGSLDLAALQLQLARKQGNVKREFFKVGPVLGFKIPPGGWKPDEPPISLFSLSTDLADISQDITKELSFSYQIPYGDGPEDTEESNILDSNGEQVGVASLTLPTYMFDGDADYTVNLSTSGQGIQYNFAYIIDRSNSMGGSSIQQAKNAYVSLTNSLIGNGVADVSQFAVIPFSSSASLNAPLSPADTISTIQGLLTGGVTNFNAALAQARQFFSTETSGATNVAYFLSDGKSNRGGDFSVNAAELQALADVRAYGIGSADIAQLNIVDSNNAVLLTDPSQLQAEFATSGLSPNDISQINILLEGNIVETIQPDQLVDSSLGLSFSGSIDNLSVAADAENKVTAEVIFKDGRPSTKVDFIVTSGQGIGSGTDQDDDIRLGATDTTVDAGAGNDKVVGNYLDNALSGGDGNDQILGEGGNDRITPGAGDDRIDGGDGIDTVVYDRTQAEEGPVRKTGGVVKVGSNTDTLTNVEFIEFADTRLSTETLEATPIVTVENISIKEGDTGTSIAQLSFNLSSPAAKDVKFSYQTIDGTATAGSDYNSKSGEITIPVGETSATIDIEVIGDTEVESDEAFTIALSELSGATFENNQEAISVITNIENDDLAANLALFAANSVKTEGNSDTTTANFTVIRLGNTNGTTTVNYAVTGSGDNPSDAVDFAGGILPSGTITFADGETEKEIAIDIVGDSDVEVDEEFTITLNDASVGSQIITSGLSGIIINDDEIPPSTTISITEADLVKSEGNSGNTALKFTVERSDNTTGETTVEYTVTGSGDNPADAADFEGGILPSGTITFADGETEKEITLNVVGDNNFELDEELTLTLNTDSNDVQIVISSIGGSIQNDDVNKPPTIDDATFTVDENSEEGTQVGIITATDPENEALTFAIVNGNVDSDNDNNLAFAIDPSTGTITVNDSDDLDFEVTPTFNLEVRATDAGGLRDTANITVNLEDVPSAGFDTNQTQNGIFTLNGGDSSNIKFTLANNDTEKVNEVGVFVVDDENGNVDGNAPGSEGYLKAALQRAEVIFSAISDRPSGFDLGDIERILEVNSEARLGFYLVSNGTTDTALAELEANGTTNLPVFFSDSSNLQVSDLVAEGFNLNWSDEVGSSDFTNLDLTVQLTQDPPASTTELQGNPQNELIDLSNQAGSVSVSVEVHREAAFDNLIGFYQVVDSKGGIDINGDGVADFNPGDTGYEQAALTNRIATLDLLQTDNQQTSTFDGTMIGGSILASFMVVDGTVDEAINNNAEVYFSFLGANSDGVDHIRLLGDNTFGYEDLAGGGDFDYNDMIVKVDFTTV